eukprot:9667062-Lingulodinium_polyedra.AAC.1
MQNKPSIWCKHSSLLRFPREAYGQGPLRAGQHGGGALPVLQDGSTGAMGAAGDKKCTAGDLVSAGVEDGTTGDLVTAGVKDGIKGDMVPAGVKDGIKGDMATAGDKQCNTRDMVLAGAKNVAAAIEAVSSLTKANQLLGEFAA